MKTGIIAPNTVLPKGASLVKPFKKKVAGWVEMTFDAKVERHGLTWIRILGGMGDNADSEAWICDIPTGCISVHDYEFREPRWGLHSYQSFDHAIIGNIERHIETYKRRAQELREKAADAEQTVKMLSAAVSATKENS